MGLNKVEIDPKLMARTEAIVLSMTPEERRLIIGWIKEQIANQEKALEEAKKASHK